MIYFVCPKCGYHITDIQWKSVKFDYKCPKCEMKVLSEFKEREDGDAEKLRE